MMHIDHQFEPDGKGFSLCRRCGRERIQHDIDVSDADLRSTQRALQASGKPSDAAVLARIGDEIIRRTQS